MSFYMFFLMNLCKKFKKKTAFTKKKHSVFLHHFFVFGKRLRKHCSSNYFYNFVYIFYTVNGEGEVGTRIYSILQ